VNKVQNQTHYWLLETSDRRIKWRLRPTLHRILGGKLIGILSIHKMRTTIIWHKDLAID
jgi:hypothetical protein